MRHWAGWSLSIFSSSGGWRGLLLSWKTSVCVPVSGCALNQPLIILLDSVRSLRTAAGGNGGRVAHFAQCSNIGITTSLYITSHIERTQPKHMLNHSMSSVQQSSVLKELPWWPSAMLALMFFFVQSSLITLHGLKWLRTFQCAVQMLLTARRTDRDTVKVMFTPWKPEDSHSESVVYTTQATKSLVVLFTSTRSVISVYPLTFVYNITIVCLTKKW